MIRQGARKEELWYLVRYIIWFFVACFASLHYSIKVPSISPSISRDIYQLNPLSNHHGSCKGVDKFFPIVSSAVPISPTTPYISTSLPHQLSTQKEQLTRSPRRPILPRPLHCQPLHPLPNRPRRLIRRNRTTIIPKLIKAYPPRHIRPHKPRMHNTNNHPLIPQIQTE